MQTLYSTIVGKREADWKAKLLIFQCVYVPSFSYGHELLMLTEKMRLQIEAARMSFLCRVASSDLEVGEPGADLAGKYNI